MTTYEGPATLIAADGTEHPAAVALRVEQDGGLKQWLGTATLDEPAPALMEHEARLRAPDGRTGRVFVTYTVPGATEVELQGAGAPPFDLA